MSKKNRTQNSDATREEQNAAADQAIAAMQTAPEIIKPEITPTAGDQLTIDAPGYERAFALMENPEAIAGLNFKIVDQTAGKTIYYGNENTRIADPRKIYAVLSGVPGVTTVHQGRDLYNFTIIHEYEALKAEIHPGDTLKARMSFYISMNKKEQEFATTDLSRLVCSNGAIRTESVKFDDFAALTPETIIKLMEANFAMQMEKARKLKEIPILASELERVHTKAMLKLQFPKKWTEEAHHAAHKESELFYNKELNAWVVYNGFNNLMFSRNDTSLLSHERTKFDREAAAYFLSLAN